MFMNEDSSMIGQCGSTWGIWDLHVHTPYSVLNNGFSSDFDNYVGNLLSKALSNDIRVIGITDYFCIKGYKMILKYYENDLEKIRSLRDSKGNLLFDAYQLERISKIRLLPNVEFRLNKFFAHNKKINFHVVFSDELSIEVIEEHFLHDIRFPFSRTTNGGTRKLKLSNIEELGKKLKEEHQKFRSDSDMNVGMMNICVDEEEIIRILTDDSRFLDKYLFVLPVDEDLSKASWDGQDHQTRKLLIQEAHCFFSSNPNTIKWGLGYKHASPDEFCEEFGAIKPCLWGSDAHNEAKLFKPDNNRFCWIKAERSFDGLLQAIKEPENRIYIGYKPYTIDRIDKSPHSFIRSLNITVDRPCDCQENWFQNVPPICFNPELTVIIGNKGQGKSAIADFLAISGDVPISNHFSFLTQRKFLNHPDAKHYSVYSTDYTGTSHSSRAISNPEPKSPIQRFTYLPQSYIESICADVNDNTIENTIHEIVYSYVDDSDRMGSKSYNEYVTNMIKRFVNEEKAIYGQIDSEVDELIELESKTEPKYKQLVEETLAALKGQLSKLSPPDEVKKPDTDDGDETAILNEIESYASLISKRELILDQINDRINECKIEQAGLSILIADVELIQRQYNGVIEKHQSIIVKSGLNPDEIIKLDVHTEILNERLDKIGHYIRKLNATKERISEANIIHENQIKVKKEEISDLQRKYRDYIEKMSHFDKQCMGLNSQIEDAQRTLTYITDCIDQDIEEKKRKLIVLSRSLIAIKFKMIEAEKKLFSPIQEEIDRLSKEIPEIKKYTVNFDVKPIIDPDTVEYILESFINMGVRGTFCGKENAFRVLSELFLNEPISNIDSVISIIEGMIQAIYSDSRDDNGNHINVISSQFKKEYNQSKQPEFYRYLFKSQYLTTLTEITSNNKSISTLSPGEKGAVLLVLFLLLDQSTNPLIIDQPEENLDNQSVYEILRPFILRAKERRQTIIITHNPNIAVACDAEQIICVKIDKNHGNQFTHTSGGIENRRINRIVVDILEGTIPAFDNRKGKYHELSRK